MTQVVADDETGVGGGERGRGELPPTIRGSCPRWPGVACRCPASGWIWCRR